METREVPTVSEVGRAQQGSEAKPLSRRSRRHATGCAAIIEAVAFYGPRVPRPNANGLNVPSAGRVPALRGARGRRSLFPKKRLDPVE